MEETGYGQSQSYDGCTVLIGIDISKSRHKMLIAVPGKLRRGKMTVPNTAADYQRVIDHLRYH